MTQPGGSAGFEMPGRTVTGRRPEMAARLLDAAVAEIAESGFDGVTVRLVASRAGVSAATAYSYFSSKEHLFTSEFLRRLTTLPEPTFRKGSGLPERLRVALEPIALLVADEPVLAAGVTTSMVAHDPDVTAMRGQVGVIFADRVGKALGPDASPAALAGFVMTFVGAFLAAGMGNIEYRQVAGFLADFATLFRDQP